MTTDVEAPRFARWLLRRLLAGPARSAIIGDLDEEFVHFIVPRLGLRKARRWYWRQSLLSIAACARGSGLTDHPPDEPPRETMRAVMFDGDGLGADVRAGIRLCLRSPWTSLAVVFTLAMGIAANTAVFSIFNAALLKKLPIAHADTLVAIGATTGGAFSYPEYELSKGAAGLSAVVAGGRTSMLFGEGPATRRSTVEMISAHYFEALGVGPAGRGRLLTASDDAPGNANVGVVSERFWRTHLNSDDSVIGRTVRLQQGFITIVGVAPAGFSGTQAGFSPDLWLPLAQASGIEGNPAMLGPGSAWLGLLGILDRTDSMVVARDALAARWQAGGRTGTPVLRLIPRGRSPFIDASDRRLRVLGVFVVLILAVACLNVATLLGAGVHDRAKELAIRAALGAGRFRLLRQLLVEHLLLAVMAAGLGGLLGVWGAWGLSPLIGDRFTPGDLDVTADGHVAIFIGVLSIVIAASVALLPAIRWSRTNVTVDLHAPRSGMPSMRRPGSLWWLIPSQVAIGTMLLASAGALVKTVGALQNEVAMLAPARVWFADLESAAPPAGEAPDILHQNLLAHLGAMPGVEAAGLSTSRPLASNRRGPLRVEGMTQTPKSRPMPWGPPPPPPPKSGPIALDQLWLVSNTYVTPGFFSALTLPIVRGRDFTASDGPAAPRVAIVNETLARRGFGTSDPIGRRVSWAGRNTFDIEIVGVVRDFRSEDLRHEPPDSIFFPLAQIPGAEVASPVTGKVVPVDVTIALRVAPGQVVNATDIVQRVRAFDSRMFADRIRTFADEANHTLSQERLLAWSGSLLGAIALVLLIVGLYATLAAAVVRGRRELGIRLALGARAHAVHMVVVRRGLLAVTAGLLVGVPLAYVFTRWISHLLYGVRSAEPTIVLSIAAIFLMATLAGTWLPARRAARVDPLTALRAE